mgnify:FL=1
MGLEPGQIDKTDGYQHRHHHDTKKKRKEAWKAAGGDENGADNIKKIRKQGEVDMEGKKQKQNQSHREKGGGGEKEYESNVVDHQSVPIDMASSDCSDMIAGIKGRKRKPRDGWDIYAWNMQKSVLTKRKNAVPAPHSFPSEAMKQEEHINVNEAKNHIYVLSQSQLSGNIRNGNGQKVILKSLLSFVFFKYRASFLLLWCRCPS